MCIVAPLFYLHLAHACIPTMLYCITCVQQVCMPLSINSWVHLDGIQGEQHQLWSLPVNTIHALSNLLSSRLSFDLSVTVCSRSTLVALPLASRSYVRPSQWLKPNNDNLTKNSSLKPSCSTRLGGGWRCSWLHPQPTTHQNTQFPTHPYPDC